MRFCFKYLFLTLIICLSVIGNLYIINEFSFSNQDLFYDLDILKFDKIMNFPDSEEAIKFGERPFCDILVDIVKYAWSFEFSHALILQYLQPKCMEHGVKNPEICRAILREMLPQIDSSVKHVFSNRTRFCADKFELFQNFDLEIPANPHTSKPSIWPTEEPPVMRILHLTDIHLDFNYVTNAPVDCKELVCCWKNSTPINTTDTRVSGPYGAYRCDIPERTLEATLRFIRDNVKFDAIYLTGDYVAHDDWASTPERKARIIRRVFELIKKYLPKAIVLGTVGNHESFPTNSYPSLPLMEEGKMQWLYDLMAEVSDQSLDEEALKTIRLGGFYTMLLKKGLRVIVLNSNFCERGNYWMASFNDDPFNQFKWMIDLLLRSESIGEKVHILIHHPPGGYDCRLFWSIHLNRIINRFTNTISAIFSGHRHNQQYRIFFDMETALSPQNILYSGPSLTTIYAGNPTFLVHKVDNSINSSHVVTDIETYSLDIYNSSGGIKPWWIIIKSLKDYYNLKDLSPDSWYQFTKSMINDEKDYNKFLKTYNNYASVRSQTNKKHLICTQVKTLLNDNRVCKRLMI